MVSRTAGGRSRPIRAGPLRHDDGRAWHRSEAGRCRSLHLAIAPSNTWNVRPHNPCRMGGTTWDTLLILVVAVVAARRRRCRHPRPGPVGLADDQGRHVRGPPHRGRSPHAPEGPDPRGQGREAPTPARGRGRGPRAPRASSPTWSAACSSATSSSTSAPTCSSSATASSSSASASSTRLARSSPEPTQEQVVALERVSGMSAEDAKCVLLEAVREEAEHDAVKLARAIERGPATRPRTRPATSSSPRCSASPRTTPPSTP